uniref:Ataxin-2 C-terminal domain-containing protein n=1 Tax=Oryza punctata TaxID=4537 RepID=A0A0E0K5K1_ORYPU
MSATAVSSLNPDAPLFIPAAFRQVEDFSPQWWDLVKTTAWFRDHWFHEHQQLDEMADDLAGLLPDDAFDDDDDDDLFFDHNLDLVVEPPQPPTALKTDAVLKALSLVSPKGGGDAPRGLREKPRQSEKPTKYAGSPRGGGGGAPRVIHQPR